MVLMTFSDRVSISQKIDSAEEKSRLKKLIRSIKPHGFGVIVRTVAQGKKVAELDTDLKNLYKKWQGISKKLKDAQTNTRIHGELNKSSVILRDLLSAKFNSLHVNNSELQNELKEYLSIIAPDQEKIVKLHKKDVHSRHGLVKLVSQRRKQLKYLRKTKLDSYDELITKLSIRGL